MKERVRGLGSAADLVLGDSHTRLHLLHGHCHSSSYQVSACKRVTWRPHKHTGGWASPDSDLAGLGGTENLHFSQSSQMLLLLVKGSTLRTTDLELRGVNS